MDFIIVGLIVVFLLAIGSAIVQAHAKRKRREYLMQKYGDAELVETIMSSKIWQGMSMEQLRDSWGAPEAVDKKVYKTKTAQTYKYGQTGKNRFSNRVWIENGVVVGWEQK